VEEAIFQVEIKLRREIIAGEGILIRDKSGSHKLNAKGYVHFTK